MGHNLGNNYGKFYSFQSKPVILDLQFKVVLADSAGYGVTSVKGQGVSHVFMQSSATPASGNPFVNTTSAGYALIQLAYNYKRIYGGPWNVEPPVTGGALAIDASALDPGVPYKIVTVGVGTKGAATINCVDDVSSNLASTWFRLYDSYGNTFIIWFSVDGVGSAPTGVAGTLVQQSISENDTDDTIADALVLTIENLASGVAGVDSFTASATTGTVTVTSTKDDILAGPPADGVIPTGFAFSLTKYKTNLKNWQVVGVKPGVVPAVDLAFVAIAAGDSTGGGSTGTVKALDKSNVAAMELLGNPQLPLNPIPMGGSPNSGGWVLVQFLDFGGSVAAPTDGSIVRLQFLLEEATPVGGNNE